MICKWSKVVNPVIFRYRRLIPGWASKGSLIVPGISTFPWLLGGKTVPWLGYAGLQAPPRTASPSPSPCRWPLGAPKFQDFLGLREPSKIPGSVSLQLQLLQSTHGKPQPRIWLNNWWCNDEMWWDVMRCDEMWWDVMRYARSSWLSDTFCSFRML